MRENVQQFLVVVSLTVVLSAVVALGWHVFQSWLDAWAARTGGKLPAGPRKRAAIRRRRLKAAVICGLLVVTMFVAAPAPPRGIAEEEPEPVPSVQQIAIARNLASMSIHNAELHYFFKAWPGYVGLVLREAGVDPVEFCEAYPEYSYILTDDPGEAVG